MQAEASRPLVLVMAGGTGGHVFPALAVAKALQEKSVAVQWLGTERGIEARVVRENGIELHCLGVQGIRGKGLLMRLQSLLKAAGSLCAALVLIRRLQPVCVIGLGGYVSGPGGVAAWLLRVPVIIHEQNAVAGTTNRLLARLSKRVLTGYPIALGGSRASYIGNPVRTDIAALSAPETRFAGREGALQLLVLGGSQGARAINQVVVDALKSMTADEVSVWHQTGSAHIETVREQYQQAGSKVRVEAFIEDMAAAYAWADVVLCRAGALTVAEIAAAGVAAWLVPLPQAIDDHQRENARWLQSHGAGEIIEQASLTAALLEQKIRDALAQRSRLLDMAQAARRLARPDAADVAANICLEYAYV